MYKKGKDKYEINDYKVETIFIQSNQTLLPRAYSKQPSHIERYRQIMGLGPDEKPTMGDNLEYLVKHQLGKMYGRYFMWNFAGRESDIQDAGFYGPVENEQNLPSSIKNNKARNNYYVASTDLGTIGIIFPGK